VKTNIKFKRYINNDPFLKKAIWFCSNGTKEWFLNGKRHREDGPAHIERDGTKYWFLNGKLHREDGPAIERSDGTKQWWLEGCWGIKKKKNIGKP